MVVTNAVIGIKFHCANDQAGVVGNAMYVIATGSAIQARSQNAGNKSAVIDMISQETCKISGSRTVGYRVVTGHNGIGKLDVTRVDTAIHQTSLDARAT